jgi:hypothetical protein
VPTTAASGDRGDRDLVATKQANQRHAPLVAGRGGQEQVGLGNSPRSPAGIHNASGRIIEQRTGHGEPSRAADCRVPLLMPAGTAVPAPPSWLR